MRCLRIMMMLGMVLVAGPVLANEALDVTDRQLKESCQATPSLGTTNYPGFSSIMPSNKLGMPPGKSQWAEGQKLYFYARVFDRNCVPVSEAKVELWHADPNGRHRFATAAALATPDAVFAGGGRTTTDNLGEFLFLTLYPGPYEYTVTRKGANGKTIKELIKRSPHFNVRVTHPDFPAYGTSLYFRGDRRNGEDHILKKQSGDVKQQVLMDITPYNGDWNNGAQVTFDIILPAQNPWRRF
jgi:protocatechuate 3,4-dioxygenase beta subunit